MRKHHTFITETQLTSSAAIEEGIVPLRRQRTLISSVVCEGDGLHTARRVRLVLHPAPPFSGIVFLRTDTAPACMIQAAAAQVMGGYLATTLGRGGVTVSTVEHLLGALAGMEVDNVLVEIDGPEVPIRDGSAADFAALIGQAGIREQEALQPRMRVVHPISLREGDRWIAVRPAEVPSVTYAIAFDHPAVTPQRYRFHCGAEPFVREIAAARTFGFLRDVDRLRAQGYALGGSLENAIVIGERGILNAGGYRFPEELVRHKILDLLGDLALLGTPLVGEVTASRAGHDLHIRLVQALLQQPEAWVREGAAASAVQPERGLSPTAAFC
ncbi:MAG: UDP-3-O-acyl-N-acetylglucosamine deacetylase [Nitrospirae bacterium]|nr:UDP-3-O-acyl-N-acetylglucosamine deacetylase [Nitrospirota bacterium]